MPEVLFYSGVVVIFRGAKVVMNINSVMQTGIQGIQKGIQGMEQSADAIVRAGTAEGISESNSFIEPIMDLKLYEQTVEASTKVVKTADEMLGTLLDTVA